MKQKNSTIKLILSTTLLMVFFVLPCYADYLTTIESISNLNFEQGARQFTAPYSILANTSFTSDLNTYRFKNYDIKILNSENPVQLTFEVAKKNPHTSSEESNFDIDKRFPWWSKSAPTVLKKLDFTKVDGKSNIYDMGGNYKLTLLANQGAWGMVYVLEHLPINADVQKICAVKLLLTRSDREEVSEFRRRHKEELKNNLIVADYDVAVKPYGIIKNDADHYLLFMEYGESACQYFQHNTLSSALERVYQFLNDVNNMHLAGSAHGDLRLDNVLFIDSKFKLCDWYSLTNINKTNVGEYRYYGWNLPPEALRALYFKAEDNLKYSLVSDQGKMRSYFLHPIAADRFCLAVGLMEIVAPDLCKAFYSAFPKGFNFYNPDSLEFWPRYVEKIRKIQIELLNRSIKIKCKKERQLYEQISKYLDVDPIKRTPF